MLCYFFPKTRPLYIPLTVLVLTPVDKASLELSAPSAGIKGVHHHHSATPSFFMNSGSHACTSSLTTQPSLQPDVSLLDDTSTPPNSSLLEMAPCHRLSHHIHPATVPWTTTFPINLPEQRGAKSAVTSLWSGDFLDYILWFWHPCGPILRRPFSTS